MLRLKLSHILLRFYFLFLQQTAFKNIHIILCKIKCDLTNFKKSEVQILQLPLSAFLCIFSGRSESAFLFVCIKFAHVQKKTSKNDFLYSIPPYDTTNVLKYILSSLFKRFETETRHYNYLHIIPAIVYGQFIPVTRISLIICPHQQNRIWRLHNVWFSKYRWCN